MSDLDRLYAAPLEEFIATRTELARAAKAAGDTARANEIGSLRKPSVSAWVVNQLSRSHPEAIRRLTGAGEAMEAAQRRALAGESADLARPRMDESSAIDQLRLAAAEIAPGITPATLERVTSTLLSGARSPAGRIALGEGRLEHDLESQGFDVYAGFPTPAPIAAKARPPARTSRSRPEPLPENDTSPIEEQIATLELRLASARDEYGRAVDAAEQAEERADEARQVAERLATEVGKARSQMEERREAVSDIEAELDRLRRTRRDDSTQKHT